MLFGLGRSNETRLFEAIAVGDEGKTRELLQSKVEWVRAQAPRSLSQKRPEIEEGVTPLHLACRIGNLVIVALLLDLKADPNAADLQHRRPLHVACRAGHLQVAEVLLDAGATLEARDDAGRTPLHVAADAGQMKVVQALLARGARVEVEDGHGNTALHYAARAGVEPLVSMLIASGADLACRNTRAQTPLHMAILGRENAAPGEFRPQHRKACMEVVTTLIRLGADPNPIDQSGETPLDLVTRMDGAGPTDPLVSLFRNHGGEWNRYGNRRAPAGTSLSEAAPAPAARGSTPPPSTRNANVTQTLVPPGTAALNSPAARTHPVPAHAAPPTPADRPRYAISLGQQPMVVGRDADCDLRYMSLTLSRKHAKIEFRDGGYVISDLGSRNGVLVDGQPIRRPHRLRPGERITLGVYEFEFDGRRLLPSRDELSEQELEQERVVAQRIVAG